MTELLCYFCNLRLLSSTVVSFPYGAILPVICHRTTYIYKVFVICFYACMMRLYGSSICILPLCILAIALFIQNNCWNWFSVSFSLCSL